MAIYRFQPNTPIPNNPFYYPLTDSLTSGGGTPLIIGAGLYVDYATGTIQSTAGTNVVTSVTGIAPIVVNGSISEPVIQVEVATTIAPGVVRIGPNLQIAAGTVSVANASTTTRGVVRLNNTTSSSATDEALTANQGRILQDQINSISAISNLTLAGTLNASTGRLATVTAAGTSKGFAVGGFLPSPVAGLTNYYVIVSTAGSYDPPGAGGPYGAVVGDWFVCDGTSWVYFAVGYVPPAATETTPGIVELATTAETEAGLDNTRAITPAGASATYIKKSTLTGKGQLISATSTSTPSNVLPGADGTLLTACAACPAGLTWSSPSSNYLPCSIITNKGIIVTGTAPNVAAALPLGTNGQYLSVNTACNTGLEWVTSTAIGCSFITGKGSLIVGCSANFPSALPVGGNGCIFTANSACTLGVEWAPNTAIPCSLIAGKGSLVTGTGPGVAVTLPICGTDNYILRTNALCCTGLEWVPNPYIPCCLLPGKGALVVAESFHTPCALAIGLDGYYLRANCLCPLGVEWAAGCPCITGVSSVTAGAGLTGGTITTTGTIAIAPTGVSPGTYYYATFSVGADGRITGAGSNFPVTCITAGQGLCGGTITCMGTICLPTFAGVAGSWIAPTMTVDCKGRITSISNGAGGSVTSVTAGEGLEGGTITTTGTICMPTIAGVSGSWSYPTMTVDCKGRITSIANGTGGVSCVCTGTGLTGGPISSTGTIALANTGVVAGTYNTTYDRFSININAQGQITSIACVASLYGTTTCCSTSLGVGASCCGGGNVAIGYGAAYCLPTSLSTNTENVWMGFLAGFGSSSSTNSCGNVGIGSHSMQGVTFARCAVAIGFCSLYNGTSCSVAIGGFAARNVLTASTVTAVGYNALNTLYPYGAEGITAIGQDALSCLPDSAGSYSTAVGGQAGQCALGIGHTFLGVTAGKSVKGDCVTAIGLGAGCGSCDSSTSVGSNAGVLSGSGWVNIGTFAGYQSLSTPLCCYSTHVGYFAGCGNRGGCNLTFGACAGISGNGDCNLLFGFGSGCSLSGSRNTFIGSTSGCCVQGDSNIAIGAGAGFCAGGCNVFIGQDSGVAVSFGGTGRSCFMVAIGQGAGYNSTYACNSVYIGAEAAKQGSSRDSVVIGYQAGLQMSGQENVILGEQAMLCGAASDKTVVVGYRAATETGSFCSSVAIGHCSARAACGSYNVILGNDAACKLCGYNNVIIGSFAAGNTCLFPTTRIINDSILIGCCTGVNNDVNNVVYIGNRITSYGCSVPCSNAMVVGGPGYNYYYWSGTWNNLSDRSVKTCICDSALGLSFLEKVQPREFSWCYDTETEINGKRCVGVIAQEVLDAVCSTVCAEHLGVVTETSGKYWVGSTAFIWPLINSVKELSAENRALRCELCDLKTQLIALGINLQ